MPAPPRAVWLDLFGTMVRPVRREALASFLRERGAGPQLPWWEPCVDGLLCAPLFAAAGISALRGRDLCLTRRLSTVEEVAAALVEIGGDAVGRETLDLTRSVVDFAAADYALEPGVESVLRRVAAAEVVTAVITNADAIALDAVSPLLPDFGDTLVASCEVGAVKPRTFDLAATRLGVPAADSVSIGDSWPHDVVGPLQRGARAIWVDRGRDPVGALVARDGAEALFAAVPGKAERGRLRTSIAAWLPESSPHWPERVRTVPDLAAAADLLDVWLDADAGGGI